MIDTTALRKAIALSEKIEILRAELNSILGGGFSSNEPGRRRGRPAKAFDVGDQPVKKRKMSAEGRARIVAAQKARWKKVKEAKKEKA